MLGIIAWLVVFLSGTIAGYNLHRIYSCIHRPKRAGRLLISRDDDGMYITAGIDNVNVLQAGNIVEFDVWEVTQNDGISM